MQEIIIKNNDLEVSVITYGATIRSIKAFGLAVTAGYDTEEGYVNDTTTYFGALVGRTANRCNGKGVIDGVEYSLPLNENGVNHLHGGMKGFDRKHFTVEAKGDDFVTLSYLSPDGEEGYPGNLKVTVTYSLVGSSLLIAYSAKTDKPTWVNFTNHSYFNPNGIGNGNVYDISVQVLADQISDYDENALVVGRKPLDGNVLDFRTMRKIDTEVDHNYYLSSDEYCDFNGVSLRKAAMISGKINVEAFTDLPCMQLYTGYFIPDNTVLSDNVVIGQFGALCLESQEEPNIQARGEGILRPDEEYKTFTAYKFSRN